MWNTIVFHNTHVLSKIRFPAEKFLLVAMAVDASWPVMRQHDVNVSRELLESKNIARADMIGRALGLLSIGRELKVAWTR